MVKYCMYCYNHFKKHDIASYIDHLMKEHKIEFEYLINWSHEEPEHD